MSLNEEMAAMGLDSSVPHKVEHTPMKQGGLNRPSPLPKTQPTQKNYNPSNYAQPKPNPGGMSIYEMAAIQATKDALPNNVPDEIAD